MLKSFINILLLIISVVVGLIIVEIIMKLLFPVYLAGHIGIYQYDEELAVRLKDDLYAINVTDHRQEMKTNHFGTVNFQESFKEYNKLIYAIGDSFTQGTGITVDTNYPFQLDLLLNMENGKYQKEYGVINLGLASYGLEQSILAIQKYKGIFGTPDYILYFGCSNDYKDDILFLNGYRHKHMVEGNPLWGKFIKPLQFLTNELEIGKRLKLVVGFYRRSSLLDNDKDIGENKIMEVENLAMRQEERLNRLYEIASSMGSELIVSWTTTDTASYPWLKQWAQQKDIGFADWAPMVESVKKEIPGLPSTNDHSGGHYRAWVNSMIAKSYAEVINLKE